MNFERLETSLFDNIFEAQLKLGYEARPLSLNYMNSTLRALLGSSEGDIHALLSQFSEAAESRFGHITFRPVTDGVCITVPQEGTAYVHENAPEDSFISQLISLTRRHGTTITDVVKLFRSHSDCVHIEDKSSSGEFDLLVYFEDGCPDSYRYCLSAENDLGCCHISYHRFIPEDYEAFGF